MNFLETCRQVIAIDSSPAIGNLEVANFLSSLAKKMGFHVSEHLENLNGIVQKNIVVRSSENIPDQEELLLVTHLDTPDPGSYGLWTETMSNPFKASIYDRKLYGLGSASGKIDFLCKLFSAREYLKKDLKIPFAIAGTYGEQAGMIGALKLLRKKSVVPKFALVGDSTDLNFVHQGAGITMVEVTIPFSDAEKKYHIESNIGEGMMTQSKVFRGQPGLGVNGELSNNAIVKMFDYISQVPEGVVVMSMDGGVSPNTVPPAAFVELDLVGGFENAITKKIATIFGALQELEKSFEEYPCEGFDSPICTINIGRIRTFKDNVKVEGSCRILPSVTEGVAEEWMEKLRSSCESVGSNFQIILNRRPFSTYSELESVKMGTEILKEMNLSTDLKSTMICSESNVFAKFGVECITFGPGKGVGNTHQPNEYVDLDDVEKAKGFYKKFIGKYCL